MNHFKKLMVLVLICTYSLSANAGWLSDAIDDLEEQWDEVINTPDSIKDIGQSIKSEVEKAGDKLVEVFKGTVLAVKDIGDVAAAILSGKNLDVIRAELNEVVIDVKYILATVVDEGDASCTSANLHGIPVQCYSYNERVKIKAGLDFVKRRKIVIPAYLHNYNVYNKIKSNIRVFANPDKGFVRTVYGFDKSDSTTQGTYIGGAVAIRRPLLSLTTNAPVYMAKTIAHESFHKHVSHNCGSSADRDDRGAYGYGAYFLMAVSKDANYTIGERNAAYSIAANIARSSICSNPNKANAVARILAAGR